MKEEKVVEKKVKIFIGDKEVIPVDSFKIQGYVPTIEEIEQFILDSGSDDLPTFGGSFCGGIYLQQVPSEFASCIKAILDSGVEISSYLEIGVAAGGTAFIINHFFHPTRIVLIDDNQHPKTKYRKEILGDISTEQIVGNSHIQTIIDSVTAPFDLVFLDGDTGYDSTMADIANYASKLVKGGFLVLHDTANKGQGVYQVVQELSKGQKFALVGEWIASTGPSCGIALFRKDME